MDCMIVKMEVYVGLGCGRLGGGWRYGVGFGVVECGDGSGVGGVQVRRESDLG